MNLEVSAYVRPAASVATVLLLWHVWVVLLNVPSYLLPTPLEILYRVVEDRQLLRFHAMSTGLAAIGGLLLGTVMAFFVGLLMTMSSILEDSLMPLIATIQSLPKLAIAPLFIVWFGYGLYPKILLVGLMTFFPVLVSCIHGIRSVDSDVTDLFRLLAASRAKILIYLYLPATLPALLSGLKIAAPISIVGAIVAEWMGATKGLGRLILQANSQLDTELVFAVLATLCGLSFVLFVSIKLLEGWLMPWRQPTELLAPGLA